MLRKFVIESMRLVAEMRASARMSEKNSFNGLYIAQNSHFCTMVHKFTPKIAKKCLGEFHQINMKTGLRTKKDFFKHSSYL